MSEQTRYNDIEDHPYNTKHRPPADTKILIVGTAPPPRFSMNEGHPDEINFYYGSRHNNLWKSFFPKIFGESFENFDQVIQFLKARKIWMVDILNTYRRARQDADDTHIIPESFTNLRTLFEQCPLVKEIILTGGHAERYFRQQLEKQELIVKYSFGPTSAKMPRKREINLINGSRSIFVYTLPSPSPRSIAIIKAAEQVLMYREILLKY